MTGELALYHEVRGAGPVILLIPPALGDGGHLDTNAEVVFSVELPGFQAYRPDEKALGGLVVPVCVLVGEEQRVPLFRDAATWLAERLGTPVLTSPGGHGSHWSHPSQLARFLVEHSSAGLRPA